MSRQMGIRLGVQPDDNAPYYWQPHKLANRHVLIVGASGSGKSTLVEHFVAGAATQPCMTVHILDSHAEHGDLARAFGGRDHRISDIGFPFRWVTPSDLPADLAADNALANVIAAGLPLGNHQLRQLRDVFEEASTAGWSNLQLRQAIEGHSGLRAHLAGFLLLLRSAGDDTLLNANGVHVFNLLPFQRPASRAAFAIGFVTGLLQRRARTYAATGRVPSQTMIVFEEAPLLSKAGVVMERVFQEGRKFGLGGLFIAQDRESVPDYVENNAATKIFLEGASMDTAASYRARIVIGNEVVQIELDSPVTFPEPPRPAFFDWGNQAAPALPDERSETPTPPTSSLAEVEVDMIAMESAPKELTGRPRFETGSNNWELGVIGFAALILASSALVGMLG